MACELKRKTGGERDKKETQSFFFFFLSSIRKLGEMRSSSDISTVESSNKN